MAYGRGRPIDSYKIIVSTDEDDGQCSLYEHM